MRSVLFILLTVVLSLFCSYQLLLAQTSTINTRTKPVLLAPLEEPPTKTARRFMRGENISKPTVREILRNCIDPCSAKDFHGQPNITEDLVNVLVDIQASALWPNAIHALGMLANPSRVPKLAAALQRFVLSDSSFGCAGYIDIDSYNSTHGVNPCSELRREIFPRSWIDAKCQVPLAVAGILKRDTRIEVVNGKLRAQKGSPSYLIVLLDDFKKGNEPHYWNTALWPHTGVFLTKADRNKYMSELTAVGIKSILEAKRPSSSSSPAARVVLPKLDPHR